MTKIMLVEDDNSIREIYQARLLAEGYEIVAAKDGEEALAIIGHENPDLILLDVMMPKISGFDTLDIIRSTPATRDKKVIMLTALSQAEDKARAEKLGADRYLVKSQVTLEDIVKIVKEVLSGQTAGNAAMPFSTTTAISQLGSDAEVLGSDSTSPGATTTSDSSTDATAASTPPPMLDAAAPVPDATPAATPDPAPESTPASIKLEVDDKSTADLDPPTGEVDIKLPETAPEATPPANTDPAPTQDDSFGTIDLHKDGEADSTTAAAPAEPSIEPVETETAETADATEATTEPAVSSDPVTVEQSTPEPAVSMDTAEPSVEPAAEPATSTSSEPTQIEVTAPADPVPTETPAIPEATTVPVSTPPTPTEATPEPAAAPTEATPAVPPAITPTPPAAEKHGGEKVIEPLHPDELHKTDDFNKLLAEEESRKLAGPEGVGQVIDPASSPEVAGSTDSTTSTDTLPIPDGVKSNPNAEPAVQEVGASSNPTELSAL